MAALYMHLTAKRSPVRVLSHTLARSVSGRTQQQEAPRERAVQRGAGQNAARTEYHLGHRARRSPSGCNENGDVHHPIALEDTRG